MKRRFESILSLAAFYLLGCGAEIDSHGQAPLDAQVISMPDAQHDQGFAVTAEDKLSSWLRVQVLSGFAELPAFGLQVSETIGLIRSDLVATVDGIVAREETCFIIVRRPDVDEVQTVIPPAFLNSIPVLDRYVDDTDGAIALSRAVEIHGAHLTRPLDESLPETIDDPRLFDQDGDGQPGVTVQIDGILEGDVQLVQRVTTRVVGERSQTEMWGTVQWTSEENVLSASNPILSEPIRSEPSQDAQASWFYAKKQADTWSGCDSVRSNVDGILDEYRNGARAYGFEPVP
ncbi:MAG: hypothetical protein ACON3Z_16165 [Bradymonadia bacterium]